MTGVQDQFVVGCIQYRQVLTKGKHIRKIQETRNVIPMVLGLILDIITGLTVIPSDNTVHSDSYMREPNEK